MLKLALLGENMKKLTILFLAFLISATSYVLADDMRFVQVDNLLYSSKNESSKIMFSKMIDDINKQKNIEFIVFSGNNIAKASAENLGSFLKDAKKLKKPYYIILGNKDVNKSKNMSKQSYMQLVSKKNRSHKKIMSANYTFTKKGLVFIVVDGSKDVLPSSIGYYKNDTLDWLEEQLIKYNDKKVIILQHFPLIPPAKRESHYTFKADEYLELLSSHKNVLAVVSGHFGVNKELEHEGIMHITAPSSPSYKIIEILNYDSEKPEFWSITKQ